MLHAPGTYIMERQCAEFIRTLLEQPRHPAATALTDIDALIGEFEREERLHLNISAFALNEAQKVAVKTSLDNRFSIITGGAGVGKTTVLKALYRALDTLGRPRFQMALSGRATARMMEATQDTATTIAGFLRNVSNEEMGPAPIIVIDEASMLDLVTFHRLVCKLPAGTHLILVGDPYQLPPIGAGLVLHVLCDLPGMPVTQLTEVKRQAKESAIPAAAKAIRDGQWPAFSADAAGEVVFMPCADDQIIPTVLRLYEQDRDSTQILGATRSCQFAGVETLNRVCHARAGQGKHLMATNPETGEVEGRVSARVIYCSTPPTSGSGTYKTVAWAISWKSSSAHRRSTWATMRTRTCDRFWANPPNQVSRGCWTQYPSTQPLLGRRYRSSWLAMRMR